MHAPAGKRGAGEFVLSSFASKTAWSALAAGDWERARDLSANFECAEAAHVSGLALWSLGDHQSAVNILDRASAVADPDPQLLSDLGVMRFGLKDWGGAAEAFTRSIERRPDDAETLRALGEALLRLDRADDAIAAFEQGLLLQPDQPEALRSLAEALFLTADLNRAETAVNRSLQLEPHSVRGLLTLAGVRRRQRRFQDALTLCQQAAQLSSAGETLARLAIAFWNAGELDKALLAREAALESTPKKSNLHSALTWLALHDPDQNGAGLLAAHTEALERLAEPVSPLTLPVRKARRPLRIGYVTGELHFLPAFCFLHSWLMHHDPERCHAIYYRSRNHSDTYTDKYKQVAYAWRDVWTLSDRELAEQIREDDVDVLVDLSGHFEDNRLGMFAWRPAPLTASFPNYPGTTGSPYVDYLFTDSWTSPPGSESEYSETLWHLPGGYLVYEPHEQIEPAPRSALRDGDPVTFGIFQRAGKLHAMWDAVAGVLRAVSHSRLLIHFASSDLDVEDSPTRRHMLNLLHARGVDPVRVLFKGPLSVADHMRAVETVDIALDSFPYNGQTTTCDCLWMGVPVVTLRGKSHVSRVTPGILARMELTDLVAADPNEYVHVAAKLASDRERLAHLRTDMRRRMQQASLLDGVRLAREIECAYDTMAGL